jgi:2-polyprenyl-3-methyl-5-hydroxy-6-metoxy-1,4-benzoquinol methylase
MSKKNLPSAYDKEEIEKHYNNFNIKKRSRYDYIIGQLPPKARILEVGCFLGHYCNHFASLGHKPTGVDISSSVIEEATKLYPDLDLRCTDGEELHEVFEENTFDAVVASEVIEHVLYPQDFLKSISKVLKPDGRLLLTTQNSNAFHYRLRMLFGQFRWDPTHLRLYSKEELMSEIEKGGFVINDMKGIPINPEGPQQMVRKLAYYSVFLNSNFCWTWGLNAKPLKNQNGA